MHEPVSTRRWPAVQRFLTRVAIALVILFFVVNFVTGPGSPEVDSGIPSLRAHEIIKPVSWLVFWLNLTLFWVGWGTMVLSFGIRALISPTAPKVARTDIEIQELFISARYGGKDYLHSVHARIAVGTLDLSTSRIFLLGTNLSRIPLTDIVDVWFVRYYGIWCLRANDPTREHCLFEITPRHPRRWFTLFQQHGVIVRPHDFSALKLPENQLSVYFLAGCAFFFPLAFAILLIGFLLLVGLAVLGRVL